jgi:outer membrane protein TolC
MRKILFTISFLISTLFCHGEALANEGSPQDGTDTFDWETVEKLDLETSQRIALSENPSIAAARDRIRQARERVRQARATYWPTLDASASYSRVSLPQSSLLGFAPMPGAPFAINDPEDYYDIDLKASWVLFGGLERIYANKGARAAEQGSQEA